MAELLAAEMPAAFAGMPADLDLAVAAGAEDRTTGTVERVTGRPPHDFRTVAAGEAGGGGGAQALAAGACGPSGAGAAG
ncbi:hypothetical protein [Streptomyces bacillaris]|uniref:hypothetical protein n=1 Tax=Streptomyces bacillaris TaxID=68179 RepID=UPI00345F542A